jgi:hypothetical protein
METLASLLVGRPLPTIEDRAVVEKILTHLGLPVDLPLPIMSTTPAGAGPTDRTTAGTPIRAARQHWRCTAIPAGGLRSWPAVCFAR